MSYLIYQVLKLKEFLLAAGVSGILMMAAFLFAAARPKQGMKEYGWQALFFSVKGKDMVYLAVLMLQVLFAVSAVLGQVTVERIHLLVLAALCLLRILLLPGAVSAVADAGSAVLTAAMLMADNLLAGFLRQAGRDWWITVMHVFLCIFIVEFALYSFFRGLQRLLQIREKGGVLMGIRMLAGRRRRRADE